MLESRIQNNSLCIKGIINVDNVNGLLKEGEVLLKTLSSSEWKINLKKVEKSDSSGIALLIAWARLATSAGKEMVVVDMPPFMHSVLNVCGLQGILKTVWEN